MVRGCSFKKGSGIYSLTNILESCTFLEKDLRLFSNRVRLFNKSKAFIIINDTSNDAKRCKSNPYEPIYILINPFQDRKSTRLNSSHVSISYAVFFLKK